MEKLEITWADGIYERLKRDNEEINSEYWLSRRSGEKIEPKAWDVKICRSYHGNGNVTLCFRVPHSLLWNDTNMPCTEYTVDMLREELVSSFPNLCKSVYFYE